MHFSKKHHIFLFCNSSSILFSLKVRKEQSKLSKSSLFSLVSTLSETFTYLANQLKLAWVAVASCGNSWVWMRETIDHDWSIPTQRCICQKVCTSAWEKDSSHWLSHTRGKGRTRKWGSLLLPPELKTFNWFLHDCHGHCFLWLTHICPCHGRKNVDTINKIVSGALLI